MNLVVRKSPRRSQPIYFPHFGNIVNELMNTSLKEVVTEERQTSSRPLTNVIDHEDKYELQLALPGVSKSDIEMNIDKDQLVIKGNIESDESTKFHLREYNFNRFERSFNLPENANKENIEASFKNGLLTVKIQKIEEPKPRQINVK